MGDPSSDFSSSSPVDVLQAEALARELLARVAKQAPSARATTPETDPWSAPAQSWLARVVRRKPMVAERVEPRGRMGTRAPGNEQFRARSGVAGRSAPAGTASPVVNDPWRDANALTLDMLERARLRLRQAPGAVTLPLADPEIGRVCVEHFAIGGLVLAAFVNGAWRMLA